MYNRSDTITTTVLWTTALTDKPAELRYSHPPRERLFGRIVCVGVHTHAREECGDRAEVELVGSPDDGFRKEEKGLRVSIFSLFIYLS